MAPASARPALSLDDRYLREEGQVYLAGMQALVRLPLDQSRRDRRAGLRIGTFISGYPGSPLGGLRPRAAPGAARSSPSTTSATCPARTRSSPPRRSRGTQMLDRYPHSRYDGVVGLWYGKGPGVDRSGDALKHGNFAGTSRHGAVVVLVRRGPRGEELDHALPGRLRVRGARHAGPLPGLDGRVPHAGPPRDRAVALLAAAGWR